MHTDTSTSFEDIFRDLKQSPEVWSEPLQFDLANVEDRSAVRELADARKIGRVIDRIVDIASDVFEMTHPDHKDDVSGRESFVSQITDQGVEYGKWFYMPWSQNLVRFADQETHQALRTFRNQLLYTADEQASLLAQNTATFGMSVGSNVVRQMVRAGIGGHSVIGDYDTISPSNLNRIETTFAHVGQQKVDQVATSVSELDPYVRQTLLRQGFDENTLESLDSAPNIIFEEVDDLAVKALIRKFAARHRIPLIMATDMGDTTLLDVERYDNDAPQPFLGRLNDKELKALEEDSISPEQKQKLIIKLVGARNITPRLLKSASENGKTLAGLPQLGSTASMGGSLATIAAREILLGRDLPSGRYAIRPKQLLGLRSPDSVRTNIDHVRTFLKAKK